MLQTGAQMPTIHRLEADNPKHGGVLVTWDENCAKQAAWSSSTHLDVKKTARKVAEGLIQKLLDEDRQDLLDATNWVSLTAGVAKHVADWNESLARRVGADVASRVS